MLRWVDKWTRRQRVLAALIATLVAVTLPFVEMLVGTKSGLYFDIITAHLPRYSAAWNNWRRGLSPNWWSSIFGGFNALGAGQSGAYYILNAFFAWVSRPLAYRMWFFLHLWLMAAGWSHGVGGGGVRCSGPLSPELGARSADMSSTTSSSCRTRHRSLCSPGCC